jgi:hypothetical protein
MQMPPLLRLSSVNFSQNFLNLSHETLPLNLAPIGLQHLLKKFFFKKPLL